ncbi:MAG: 3-phosphoshikimate 1-carboxyvinyltransferase [Prevotella sp.]|jgi:3-phosphoshikimate 1-carboxyvinyltransferase|nr:3-phosphoshikimate 1-carboxyvinyltransferase [Prevotella sp.]
MQYTINPPKTIDTTIKLPASKSISNRVLIINALAGGNIIPQNISECDDTDVTLAALKNMPEVINIKAAGTAMRFLTAYLAATPGKHIITGTERMKRRPIGLLVDALRMLGADIEYVGEEGFPPLKIKGKTLMGGTIDVKGNMSSQFISALLMIAPTMINGLELRMTSEIISRPYIDLTLWTMREYGADADWTSGNTIMVKPKMYKQRDYLIENDWSAASYWYEILALNGDADSKVNLEGLMDGSKQGDSMIRYIFSMLGVKTKFESKEKGKPTTITLSRNMRKLPRMDYDFVSSPDLAQTVVTCCCAMNVPFRFEGLSTLKIKETDRILALEQELKKLGFVLHDIDGKEMYWDGERCEATMEPIDTYEDHRMAMAFAPLAIKYPGLKINDPQVVSKSYPKFWDDLRQAGFEITEE